MAAGGDEEPGAAGGGGTGGVLAATSGRSVDKALEEAAASGQLNLSGRKLKEFPRSARNFDLSDITHADLSKNRLCELPEELCQFISLETVILYHNGMRALSPNLSHLQALTYLNLSRNLLSSLPPAVCQLPLLRVLIFSNNKLSSLPASIHSLTHLRQLDVSCNELQCLPPELGQLESLRDLNLRRNQLTTLPEEIADLPLVRLDVSCNRISHLPVCYRRLRSLQSMALDNNPLLLPPAHVCSKGQYHVFKYLHLEAHRRRQEEEMSEAHHLRPTAFNSCLSDQELFSVQFGGLDSGFNSVDSGNKRWSGNESADDFSERSLRLAETSRDPHRNLEEEVEEDPSPLEGARVNGDGDQVDFIDSSVTEEEDEESPPSCAPLTTAPPAAAALAAEQKKMQSSPSHSSDSSTHRSSLHVELGPPQSSSSSPSPASPPCVSPSSPSSPSSSSADPAPASSPSSADHAPPPSPSLEERRRPGTLLLWQERERQHLLKSSSSKTGSHVTATPQAGSCSSGGSPENTHSHNGLRHRCASADQMSAVVPAAPVQRSVSRTDVPSSPQTSSPPGQAQKPNSFLFRTSSRHSFKSTGSSHSLVESGRSESRTTLRSPREERPDVVQLRKTLECRLKVSLPEDLGEALSNGTVLCQLVNQIRPRAVQMIHIPSPAVPKLSSAKCRLNVENFISACRRLGVPETEVCACSDVFLCKTSAVQRCVSALLEAVSAAPKRLEEEEEEGEETSLPLCRRRGAAAAASQHSSSPSPSSSSSSSSSSPLLSTDFLLFYAAAMTLLYVLYCCVLG